MNGLLSYDSATNTLKSPSSYCDAVTLCLMRGEACGVGCRVRRMRNLASEETRDRNRKSDAKKLQITSKCAYHFMVNNYFLLTNLHLFIINFTAATYYFLSRVI